MKKRFPAVLILILLALILFLAGIAIIATPTFNRMKQESLAKDAVAAFLLERNTAEVNASALTENMPRYNFPTKESDVRVEALPSSPTGSFGRVSYQGLFDAMKKYNNDLYQTNQRGLSDPWCYTASVFDLGVYGLNSEVIGVLTIPAMKYEEPVYLGATSEHLSKGAAQLSISSMPIGGVNTNCVLAGHRGWHGALHFRHIDLLKVGDSVTLINLWDELEYKVAEIKIIDPWQTEALLIQPGRDLLTLITCHPYGSGGQYRYLVICERSGTSERR